MQRGWTMRIRRLIWLVTVISLAPAAEKKPPAGAASNPSVRIEATAYLDKESVRQVLGSELDASIVVLEVRLTPASGKSLKVFFDDFLLRSEKDGQRSGAFHPSQIAGNTVLRVGSAGGEVPTVNIGDEHR